jgi:hypothetical protein
MNPPRENGGGGNNLEGSPTVGLEFLAMLASKGPWVLLAIEPNTRKITCITYYPGREREAEAWLKWHNGRNNIYFNVNLPRERLSKKAEKKEIGTVITFHVDCDPREGFPLDEERARILAVIRAYKHKPSFIIDSGGGYQPFYLLKEPHEIADPAADPEAFKKTVEEIESRNRQLEEDLGGDHCHDISRIMRLPGTINIPDKKKLEKGRRKALASVVDANWNHKYAVTDLKAAAAPKADETMASGKATPFPRRPMPEWCSRTIEHGHDPVGERHFTPDRSRTVWAVACELVRCGWFDNEIADELINPKNGINAHVLEQAQPKQYALRQAQKARSEVGRDWVRGGKDNTVIIPNNLTNMRLAFHRMGVIVSYDEFAQRKLVEGPGDLALRYMDDAVINHLRFEMMERFGSLPEEKFFRDFLDNEARTYGTFHPFKDYLASLSWDGTKRLDTWLKDYAGAANTDFIRAVSAIVLTAAVRRVRHPGIKFDEMLVLESPQGLDKSTALSTLALKPEWFTDSLPMNAKDKETIERATGKVIVEMAELRGMKNVEIEHLKSQLSRQIDRDRLAYGHERSEVARTFIFVGTTNSEQYLKDISGNRRFWPVRIKKFDIPKLLRDRDQLWAEAAARETAGESIRLAESLWDTAAQEQEERVAPEPWIDQIDKELGDRTGNILPTDTWKIVGVESAQWRSTDGLRLRESLKANGWERTDKKHLVWRPELKRQMQCFVKGNYDERKVCLYLQRDRNGPLLISSDPPAQADDGPQLGDEEF